MINEIKIDIYKCLEFKGKCTVLNKVRKLKYSMKEIISKDYC